MTIYHYILISSFLICGISLFAMLLIALTKKGIFDPSPSKGSESGGVKYSLTSAMSPKKKESAYMHLPTYLAGLLFHVSSLLSYLWLILLFLHIASNEIIIYISAVIIFAGAICGLAILIKRMVTKLGKWSNADDYISNILVTGFQFIMAFAIVKPELINVLFVFASILFLYLPLGKLRHSVYFFAARIHLGKFFGKRGVWSNKTSN